MMLHQYFRLCWRFVSVITLKSAAFLYFVIRQKSGVQWLSFVDVIHMCLSVLAMYKDKTVSCLFDCFTFIILGHTEIKFKNKKAINGDCYIWYIYFYKRTKVSKGTRIIIYYARRAFRLHKTHQWRSYQNIY